MNRTHTTAAFFLALAASHALADDTGLQRCRAIKDSAQRLACYDALPLAPAPVLAPSSPVAAAPAGSTAAQSAPAAAPSLLARFGFEQRAQPNELATVESYIPGRFEGWGPSSIIKLANGQVWQVSDGSSRTAWVENPKVKITRGAFGSFFLEIERVNPAPRVRRVQ